MKHSIKKTYFEPSVLIMCIDVADVLGASMGVVDFNPNWLPNSGEEVEL